MHRILLSTAKLIMAVGETPAFTNPEFLQVMATPIMVPASIHTDKLDTAQLLNTTVTIIFMLI